LEGGRLVHAFPGLEVDEGDRVVVAPDPTPKIGGPRVPPLGVGERRLGRDRLDLPLVEETGVRLDRTPVLLGDLDGLAVDDLLAEPVDRGPPEGRVR
jgi:hypothetical protein